MRTGTYEEWLRLRELRSEWESRLRETDQFHEVIDFIHAKVLSVDNEAAPSNEELAAMLAERFGGAIASKPREVLDAPAATGGRLSRFKGFN